MLVLALTACGGGGTDDTATEGEGGAATALTVGTTDKITTIDPAGSYDNGSFAVMNQVYPFLLNTPTAAPTSSPTSPSPPSSPPPPSTRSSSSRA